MKKFFAILLLLSSCSKNTGDSGGVSGENATLTLLLDKYWRPSEWIHNGVSDPSVLSSQPTYQFLSDGRVYITQAYPTLRDTFKFDFLNSANLKLTKPWVNTSYTGNLRIDQLTDSEFDFTLTSNANSDVDAYKTQKL